MNCKGQYVQYANNNIQEVVALCEGNVLRAFTKEQYVENHLEPKIEDLPDKQNFQPEKSDDISPIILALLDWTKGKQINSETTYRMQQFGYVFPDSDGILRITPGGEQVLKSNGLS